MPREGASGDHGLAHTQAGRGTGEVAAESPALAPLPPWGFGKAVPAPVGRWQGGPPGAEHRAQAWAVLNGSRG